MAGSDLWNIEHGCYSEGYQCICGVDEAGRGPLAGPVCAAAVILPPDLEIPGLNDSKKLTDKKRRELYELIVEKAIAHKVVMIDEKVIDEINILQATLSAMQQCVSGLDVTPDMVLVDGNRAPALAMEVKTVIKGDSLSANIAAASILAKVTRDQFMEKVDEEYPQYGFSVHKGYGTKRHYEALREFGPCAIHRMTFLKKFYEKG